MTTELIESSGSDYNLNVRVSILESQFPHLATKKDISDLKNWILLGVLGGIVTGVIAVSAILRFI